MKLTIGMATYRDFDGVYFSVQALRLYHQLPCPIELLVVDNWSVRHGDKTTGCEETRKFCVQAGVRYVHAPERQGTAAPRDLVFRLAQGDVVLCLDCHVLFPPDSLHALVRYFVDRPECRDLVQGPLLYDDHRTLSTHFEPKWQQQMYGVWGFDKAAYAAGQPFDIPMQGLGMFAMRRAAWPGFNPHFRGFGGEEGYLHEKVRQHGGRTLCLPQAKWLHRFGRPAGAPYRVSHVDRIFNYLVGWRELGLDTAPIVQHFTALGLAADVARAQDEVDRLPTDGTVLPPPARTTILPATTKTPLGWHAPVRTVDGADAVGTPATALVSCLCMTHGRMGVPGQQELLEEAVESFLRQTYPHRELLILNDQPTQQLVCHAPGVQVINLPRRCASLGEKMNILLGLAQGELVAIWDDDDISLPERLRFLTTVLRDDDYLNPRGYWYLTPRGLQHQHRPGVAFNASLVRRTALTTVGLCPPVPSGYDAVLDQRLRQHPQVRNVRFAPGLLPQSWTYIYRWGVSRQHVSAHSDKQRRYAQIGTMPAPAGTFTVEPRWHKDYHALTQVHLQQLAPVSTPGSTSAT